MAGTYDISLKGRMGETLATITEYPVGGIVATGLEALINAVPHKKVRAKKTTSDGKEEAITGYVATTVLSELDVTTVSIPANFAGLEAVSVPTRLTYQFFDIISVHELDGYVEVVALHQFYRLRQNFTTWKGTSGTNYPAAAVCRNVMTNAIFDANFDVASDCTDTAPGGELDYARNNLVEAFLNPESGICAKFGLSLLRDNDAFYCLKNVGYNRGFVIMDGKNLLSVDREESVEDTATRIIPVGKDADGNYVWLNNNGTKYVDSSHLGDYPVPKGEILYTDIQIGQDGTTAENINEKLLQAALDRLDERAAFPEVTLTIDFVSLGDTEEFSQYRGQDKVYLYDIITIIDTVRGYNYSAQVIGVEHDVLTGRLNSVTIGDIRKGERKRIWRRDAK